MHSGVDEQVIVHSNTIKQKFKELHESLNDREKVLIQSLTKMANERKHILLKKSNTLKQQQVEAQQVHIMFFHWPNMC